ncbi:hypothetical protein SPRG_06001 [Saprolegnia parasitica CBS 223.65]|uniref:Uncharacterized protein n=1 Tax=Saprolegnia parasitica (strain CBS 223.65) TaxID=695850 RepID=A0A067CG22_SAPPC|nr:hypothetical protein SPRG_06001 [Saprolegnia parasitica CBS 223.65]KDO29463.1 hypothetical protein SPRG_06001 [Saprolegnia parasitica CBS 223.65]|eukprot:XP_012199962.1 hypothetical protein SPRG_06001 [Saprolegnia parasitica CBS 223.65]
MGYLCCSIFSFAGAMFLLCLGALLRLQPRFIPKVKTPQSSSDSCFISAGVYGVLWIVCIVLWRRQLARLRCASLKEPLPSELFGTTMSYHDWDDPLEEVAPLVDKPKQRLKPPSIQHA